MPKQAGKFTFASRPHRYRGKNAQKIFYLTIFIFGRAEDTYSILSYLKQGNTPKNHIYNKKKIVSTQCIPGKHSMENRAFTLMH